MNKTRLLYWTTTGIFSAIMLFSGIMYFISPDMIQTFDHLGFPDYFRVELGIAKIVGVLLLLAPFTGRLKEWVYAGFTFNMISASIAHGVVGDSLSAIITPIVFLGILSISYSTYRKLKRSI